jgi:hypothetical protein
VPDSHFPHPNELEAVLCPGGHWWLCYGGDKERPAYGTFVSEDKALAHREWLIDHHRSVELPEPDADPVEAECKRWNDQHPVGTKVVASNHAGTEVTAITHGPAFNRMGLAIVELTDQQYSRIGIHPLAWVKAVPRG